MAVLFCVCASGQRQVVDDQGLEFFFFLEHNSSGGKLPTALFSVSCRPNVFSVLNSRMERGSWQMCLHCREIHTKDVGVLGCCFDVVPNEQ